MKAIVLLAAAVGLGCGQSPLTVTLSGPVNGTFAITRQGDSVAGAVYTDFSVITVSPDPQWAFSCTFNGVTLETGTFSESSANYLACASEIDASSADDAPSWGQNAEAGSGTSVGTFSLNISSVGASSSNPGPAGGMVWNNVHGSLNATLLPRSGNPSAANVTVSALF